jgi:hypothetical protein
VKYIDPDGRESFSVETTKEQYDDMTKYDPEFLREDVWNSAQEYFEENPDGVYYRAPGELHWQQFENKDDINSIDPNSANFDILSGILIGKSLLSLGKTVFNGLNRSPAHLQQVANESIAKGVNRNQLINLGGKIRIEKGVESVNSSLQNQLGVKISGSIQKPWHLVINGREIPLNPLNPLWRFFNRK